MRSGYGNKIKSFCEIDSFDFTRQLSQKVKNEIEEKGKEYILGVDETEFINYLVDKYSLEPLVIDRSSETTEEPKVSRERLDDGHFREYQADVYTFPIRYNFTGSAVLFKVKPSSWIATSTEIYVKEKNMTVSFSFRLTQKGPEEFNRKKDYFYGKAFDNLNNANGVAKSWNKGLRDIATSNFQALKNKYQEENDFFKAINVKINKDTTSIFSPPTIKKKIIPQPIVSKNKEISSEPGMAKEMYDDILKIIYDLGKSIERKPSTYQGKDEEGLRDQFLLILETRYEGTTASGETFNRSGKTDIILKYSKDGSNLFVAECKFWHGSSEFLKAISQLFDKYLTWRDSKAALLLFVTNKNFTDVLQTIRTEIKKHPYYVKENGTRGETSYSYIFRLPQDEKKPVYFEVITFHYDKQES